MSEILVLKIGALGDVLRTTSVLPGLRARHPGAAVHWVTAPAAVDLVRRNPLVETVHVFDPDDAAGLARLELELVACEWLRVISLDDEAPVGRLATLAARGRAGVLTGAYLDEGGSMRYTPDSAPWFDMGLLSVHGKAEADRRKRENTRSHPELLAQVLGVALGEPRLDVPEEELAAAAAFAERHGLRAGGVLIGLNTGAGGRWESKKLSVERTGELALELSRRLAAPRFLLLGGPAERARNDALLAALEGRVPIVDAGTENPIPRFAALVDLLDLLVTSDSLALHVAIARRVPLVAFFAPTSAAEIELYGRGEKVASTAPDACSYRPDADTSTLTVERLAAACERVLAAHPPRRRT